MQEEELEIELQSYLLRIEELKKRKKEERGTKEKRRGNEEEREKEIKDAFSRDRNNLKIRTTGLVRNEVKRTGKNALGFRSNR